MQPLGEPVSEYRYTDEGGGHLYSVLRYEPKTFRQRRADGTWLISDVPRVPFKLPELMAAIHEGRTIVCAEGEKDALALIDCGFAATTSAGGCGWPWTPEFAEHFRDAKRIVVLVDSDGPGRSAGTKRANLLTAVCDDVRLLDLAPDREDGFDVSDWLREHGDNRAELKKLMNTSERVAQRAFESIGVAAASRQKPPPRLPGAIRSVRASDVPIVPIKWLWRDFIPAREVTLLEGDGGVGKSSIAIDLIARVTRGDAMPGASQ